MKFKYILKVSLGLLLAGEAIAEESRWGIGAGGMVDRQGYANVDANITVIPIISYESENFRISGPQIEYTLAKYKVPDFGSIEFSALGKYRFDGYEVDDGDIFIGMDKRSGAFELGFSVDYRSKLGSLSFEFSNDASSNHEGYEASLTYSKPYFFESIVLEPYVKVSQLSDDFVNYYYGVEAHEVSSVRNAYQGEATINYGVGLRMQWQAGKHHRFIWNLSYSSFGNEIKDSPLIEESGGGNLILGYFYDF